MTNEPDDLDFEIDFFEGFLKKRPNYSHALIALGEVYTKIGLYQEGLRIDKQLAKIRPKDPVIFYNLACSYSLLNSIEDSAVALERAIKLGYRDFNWLKKDPDLENLRESLAYSLIIKPLLKRKRIKEEL